MGAFPSPRLAKHPRNALPKNDPPHGKAPPRKGQRPARKGVPKEKSRTGAAPARRQKSRVRHVKRMPDIGIRATSHKGFGIMHAPAGMFPNIATRPHTKHKAQGVTQEAKHDGSKPKSRTERVCRPGIQSKREQQHGKRHDGKDVPAIPVDERANLRQRHLPPGLPYRQCGSALRRRHPGYRDSRR